MRHVRLLLVVILGAAPSLSIECMQIYLPDRVTSIYDLILDTFGTGLGVIFGWASWRSLLAKWQTDAKPPPLFPVLLGGAWAGYRLFP